MAGEPPEFVPADLLAKAAPAIALLCRWQETGAPPGGLTVPALDALLIILAGVMDAATGENAHVSPSEAAALLAMSRPSVMRLIARGELPSHKDGGHYVLSPRDIRVFQLRLASIRREALAGLTGIAEEFGF